MYMLPLKTEIGESQNSYGRLSTHTKYVGERLNI